MSTPLTILHDGHRKVMRVGANDNMSTVVQMACKEFGLDAQPGTLALTHKRVPVDLSQPFRFTGIPQNATLELTNAPAVSRGGAAQSASSRGGGQVRVAMKLPGGRRMQASFTSDTTLQGLLQFWVGTGDMDAGVLQQRPSLQFMRTAYGSGELESTTLRSIGLLTGTAMFTLSLSAPNEDGGSASSVAATSSTVAVSTGDAKIGGVDAGMTGTAPITTSTAEEREAADIARAIALSSTPDVVPMDQDGPSTPATGLPVSSVQGEPSVGDAGRVHVAAATLAKEVRTPPVEAPTPAPAVRAGAETGSDAATADTPEVDPDNSSAAPSPAAEFSPTMGIETCRAALTAMSGAHFDADSASCVVTLAKIIDNVIHRPEDTRTRQMRCANAAFQQKVGRIQGGIAFLEGVGFVSRIEETPTQLLGGSGRGGGGRILVLSPDREDVSLLEKARDLLTKQALLLGIPREKMPQPPWAPPPPPAASSHGAHFDPYKPFITSTAPTPKGPQEQSLTEKRLMELQSKMEVAEAGGVPERNIQVTLPRQAAALAAAAAGKGGDGDDDSNMGMGMGGGGYGGGTSGGDGGLIAKKVARQMAERKKLEDMPFQTRAMREIERLQKATVYRNTVIKVQFPDRVVVQATFGSREGVVDLVNLVRECLGESHQDREFQLYVSPPRTVLKESSSLSEAGLVPAALVYVSWQAVPPSGEVEGGYLKSFLTSDAQSGNGGAASARPVGIVLDPGQAGAKGGLSGAGTRPGSGGAASGSSGSGSKRKGKPSWLKIN